MASLLMRLWCSAVLDDMLTKIVSKSSCVQLACTKLFAWDCACGSSTSRALGL